MRRDEGGGSAGSSGLRPPPLRGKSSPPPPGQELPLRRLGDLRRSSLLASATTPPLLALFARIHPIARSPALRSGRWHSSRYARRGSDFFATRGEEGAQGPCASHGPLCHRWNTPNLFTVCSPAGRASRLFPCGASRRSLVDMTCVMSTNLSDGDGQRRYRCVGSFGGGSFRHDRQPTR